MAGPGIHSAPLRRLLDRALPDEPTLRPLALATLAVTFGTGLFFTTSALYFTRIVGLSASQLGLGLAIAGLCGVLAGVPFGHLGDRRGPRRLLVLLVVLEAACTFAYAFVGSFIGFVVVATAVAVLDRGGSAVRNALIATAVPEGERVRGRAHLRSLTNVGIGAGSAFAAIALHVDTRAAYVTLIVIDGLLLLLSAVLIRRMPPIAGERAEEAPHRVSMLVALRDRPYVVMTVLCSILALQFGILEVGLPLWVVGHTEAPRTVVSLALLTNTALVVVLQIRASRGTEDVAGAARACAISGVLLAGACGLYAVSAEVPAAAAVGVVVLATVVLSGGEVLSAAGGWGLSYELARPEAPGQYQGVFNSGFAAAMMLGPLLQAALPLALGTAGWLALGALFAVTGLALRPVAAWAARSGARTAH